MMSAPDVSGEVLRTIGALFQSGDVIEIRALDVGRTPKRPGITFAGYFNFENAEAIRKAVRELDGRAEGIYVILNPFDPNLLARANNRLQAGLRQTTTDKDIIQWRWLYIDCDSERPAGISATDQEHKAALDRAATIREFTVKATIGCRAPSCVLSPRREAKERFTRNRSASPVRSEFRGPIRRSQITFLLSQMFNSSGKRRI